MAAFFMRYSEVDPELDSASSFIFLYLIMSPRNHKYWVYIITNKPEGVLYIGVTGNIDKRMVQHSEGKGSAFTKRYNLKQLVHLEEFQYINDAIKREKQLKSWRRQWKIDLIKKENPDWDDLRNT